MIERFFDGPTSKTPHPPLLSLGNGEKNKVFFKGRKIRLAANLVQWEFESLKSHNLLWNRNFQKNPK